MAPQHLKYKKARLVELKDSLLAGELRYRAYIRKALPLQKEIEAMEADARALDRAADLEVKSN